LAATGAAFAGGPSTDDFVRHALLSKPQGRIALIVRSSEPLSPTAEAKLGHLGGYVYRHLPIVRSTAIDIPAKNLRKLMALSYVEHVSRDTSVRKTDAFTVGASGADVAWQQYGTSGNGVGVAILDSGIRDSDDFDASRGSRVRAAVNFAGDGGTHDKCGHGTHVAGIVAGNAENSTGEGYFASFSGVAPKASLINVRVLDAMGGGDVSDVVAGIQWVVAHRQQYNIRVMNLSLGHPVGESYTTDPLCQAVEYAWKKGIVVVCSAGNGGRLNASQVAGAANEGYGTAYGSIQSPGNDPYVITVGAMKETSANRSENRIATYSSRGPSRLDFIVKPDIVAPGNRVVSVLAKNS
jgi:serine protease AprX